MRQGLEVIPSSKGYVVYDPSLCTGCLSCEAACSANKNHGMVSPELSRIQVSMDIFSGEISNFEPKPCLQCADPVCLRACPVEGAIYVDAETGARVVDEGVCTGCQLCIEACSQSYEPPRIRFDRTKGVAFKCDLCGGEPQCVRWCPNGALRYLSLHEFKELGGCHSLNFDEPYTKDFGPSFEAFEGNQRTLDRVYPGEE